MAIRTVNPRGKKIEVLWLKELAAKINVLQSAVVSREAAAVIGDAAAEAKRQVLTYGMIERVPSEALKYAFVDARQKLNKAGAKLKALVGIKKRGKNRPYIPGYREWIAGRHPKSPRAKVPPGGLVGESLAAMYNLGTASTNYGHGPGLRETNFFGKAIQRAKALMPDILANGFKAILEKAAKL